VVGDVSIEVDIDEFNRDIATICRYAGESEEDRNAAAFLLAVAYCGNRPRRIAQLARLSRELTRYYLDNVAKYMVDRRHGFICQWPHEERGPMSFVLDMLVVRGKIMRRWDREKDEFVYQAIPEDQQTQPKQVHWKRRAVKPPASPKHVVEIKLSARREGLAPMKGS
jgi:hypothetical protein